VGILWKDQLNNTLFDVLFHKQTKRTHLWLNQKAKKGGINRKLSVINSRYLDTKKVLTNFAQVTIVVRASAAGSLKSKFNNFPMS